MKCLLVLSVIIAIAAAAHPWASIKPTVPKLPTLSDTPPQEGRITNGETAELAQFPYQAGLSLVFGTSGGWCGGSIISERWILTAAHCCDGADAVTVYLGAFDIYNKDEPKQQRIYSEKMIVHENWDPATLTNDIALIQLPVKIPFNDYIQAIALPKKNNNNQYANYDGVTATASGWGRPSDSVNSVSQYLRYIDVPIMPYQPCNLRYFGVITDNMICIDTTGKKSTCNGDSGGPLVTTDNGQKVLIGATSFGISLGCEKEWPGVFTRVTSYVDWIEANSGVSNK